ncbi:hypothetical protein [Leptodesmis sp.]|uniref:hypothetical protein n=1 Tax=Leptodesmis sp. TaxID=3100501 RepID=UPI0040535ABC
MYKNKLFNLSRRRLALWYAGVMGVILSAGVIVLYHMITQTRWQALHRELESVAGTLHDGLEPVLKQPGQMNQQAVNQVLPYVCLANTNCSLPPELTHRHRLSLFQQKGDYIRFLDLSGRLVAAVGQQPEGLAFRGNELWQTLEDRQGNRFHQISMLMDTAGHQQSWGYMQIGRSLKDFDEELTTIAWLIGLSLPISMLLIAEREQAHIFDRFYRVHRDRCQSTGGAGLGLAIAQAIAEAHQDFTASAAINEAKPVYVLTKTFKTSWQNCEDFRIKEVVMSKAGISAFRHCHC